MKDRLMTQTSSPKIHKFHLYAALAVLFPVFLVGMAFFAAKKDAETQKKYDQLQVELEERTALKKQQAQQENRASSSTQP